MWQFPDAPDVYRANIEGQVGLPPWPTGEWYLFGKKLPKIKGIGTVHVQSQQIRLWVRGQRVTLYETGDLTQDFFPSDALLAQVMLVAG